MMTTLTPTQLSGAGEAEKEYAINHKNACVCIVSLNERTVVKTAKISRCAVLRLHVCHSQRPTKSELSGLMSQLASAAAGRAWSVVGRSVLWAWGFGGRVD